MNQQVQDMMALAQQQGRAQQGVAVGACGPMAYNPGMGNGAQQMSMYGEGGIPPNGVAGGYGCGPIPVRSTVPPCGVQSECYTAFGIRMGLDAAGNVYPYSAVGSLTSVLQPFTPQFTAFTRRGTFQCMGFTSFNDPGEVGISLVSTGDTDFNLVLGEVDAATWNTDDCFCPVDWGCFSITNPIRIQARGLNQLSVTTVIGFSGTCWGIATQSFNSCGPTNICPPGGY